MFRPKKVPLPARPEPPNLENLHKDIENAPFDDVAFTSCRDNVMIPILDLPATSFLANNSYEETSFASDQDSSISDAHSTFEDVEKLYHKVVTLVSTHKKLQNADVALSAQSQHLAQLGTELNIGMEELKKQAALANIHL